MRGFRLAQCLLATIALTIGPVPGTARAQVNSSLNLYGFGEADVISDSNRVDPSWEDAFRPSKIATAKGEFGSNGQTSVSVKQSRFGVQTSVPVENFGPATFRFEFDLFGVGVDAGQTTFRLRHAYGEVGQLLAGQTNSVFMDADVFPNIIDYWGPPGMVFYRNVQIRWTPYRTDNNHFAIAVERPGNDIDVGQIREIDPELGANVRSDEKLPDVTAHFYTSGSWGHVQLAGIVRYVGFDSPGTPNNEPKGHQTGWGINLGAHATIFERDRLMGQVVYGHGIASYMNDGGVDLAPGGTHADPHAEAVPLLGIVAYYDHYWSDSFSSSLGYSFTQVDNTSLQDPNAFRKGEYASFNLLYTPLKSLMIGGEVLWGKRTDNDSAAGDDWRFQFSVRYSFSTAINL